MASELASALPDKSALSSDKERTLRGDSAGSLGKPPAENAPTQSPWWSAPAGRPVPIPAFGRTLFVQGLAQGRSYARSWIEALLDLLLPKPVLVPVKVKAPAKRLR